MKITEMPIEKLKEILRNAPKGATHVVDYAGIGKYDYLKNPDTWAAWYGSHWSMPGVLLDLSDKTIIKLSDIRARIAELDSRAQSNINVTLSAERVESKGVEQSDTITVKLDPAKCRIFDPALAYDEPLTKCELKSPVTQIPDDILTTTFAPLEQLIPDSIEKTLAERGQRYGEFPEHARITQNIKRAMADSPNWYGLADDQKEALEMLAHKIGRILNGDPDYHDSWHDIVGYTKLVADRLKGE